MDCFFFIYFREVLSILKASKFFFQGKPLVHTMQVTDLLIVELAFKLSEAGTRGVL